MALYWPSHYSTFYVDARPDMHPLTNCLPNRVPCVEIPRHWFIWEHRRRVADIDGFLYIGRGPHCGRVIGNLHPRLVQAPDSGWWTGPPAWCQLLPGGEARRVGALIPRLGMEANPLQPEPHFVIPL